MVGYQRLFRERLRAWLRRARRPDVDLHAELLAAAVVTAHNVVLRRWLRGVTAEPGPEFEDAMDAVFAMARGSDARTTATPRGATAVVVVASDRAGLRRCAVLVRARLSGGQLARRS